MPTAAADRTPDRADIRLVLVLGALIALGPLTIDVYLPALPTIAADLAISDASVQLTITTTLLGLACGQLVIGPLSDTLGRRRPLIGGTILHVAASVACLVAPNLGFLAVCRGLQGFGAASAAVVAMATVRDLHSGRAAALLLSRLMLVLGVAPIFAPSLGAAVLRFTSWRGVFGVLAVGGAVVGGLALWKLPETLPPDRRRTASLHGIAGSYGQPLRDPAFLRMVVVGASSTAAMWAYLASSSFIIQEQYELSEQAFAVLFSCGGLSFIAGTQLNMRLLRHFEPAQVLRGALRATLALGLTFLAIATAGIHLLPVLLLIVWSVMAMSGIANPNAPALALARHGNAAGSASALIGASRHVFGALVTPLVGLLGNDERAVAIIMTAAGALGVALMRYSSRHDRFDPTEA